MAIHKNLMVWENSVELVIKVYHITSRFPKEELFSLTSQIRRAAVSVPANISEGASRNQQKEYIRFLRISFGSINELETLLLISSKLGYINENDYEMIRTKIKIISAQLSGLINSITKSLPQTNN